jgi:DNA-binding MarR family transcriptional regulator
MDKPDRTPAGQGSLANNIAFQMACVISRMEQELRDSVLRGLDLSYSHFRALEVLFEMDGQQIGDLAKAVVVRQPVLSRVVDQMEERALVRRRPDSRDSRITRVWLTPTGRKAFRAALPGAQQIVERALSWISPEERKLLGGLLRRMNRELP